MHDHDRRRVRRERDGTEAPPLPEPALLALQRSAGNQAVARLIYTGTTGTVTGPESYATQRMPWDNATKRRRKGEEKAKSNDPTLFDLAKDSAVREMMKRGLNVPLVKELKIATPQQLTQMGGANTSEDEIRDRVSEMAAAENAIVEVVQGLPIDRSNANDRVRKVLKPIDYLPEPDDLDVAGASVRAKRSNQSKSNWQMTCTLIALYKQHGIGKVKSVTGNNDVDDTIDSAIQALHDYYVGVRNVQYDDSSTRYTVMNDWGYRLAFSGESSWLELKQHVMLRPGGRYIFDIEGHTVKVTIKRTYGLYDVEPEKLTDVYECHSDSDNYSPGAEFNKKILYVWQGS